MICIILVRLHKSIVIWKYYLKYSYLLFCRTSTTHIIAADHVPMMNGQGQTHQPKCGMLHDKNVVPCIYLFYFIQSAYTTKSRHDKNHEAY